jgi:hypothetical protein
MTMTAFLSAPTPAADAKATSASDPDEVVAADVVIIGF